MKKNNFSKRLLSIVLAGVLTVGMIIIPEPKKADAADSVENLLVNGDFDGANNAMDVSGWDVTAAEKTPKMEKVELVTNGDFEDGFDSWTLCHGIGSAVTTSAYISLETGEVHGGNNSVKLSCDSTVNKGVQQDIAISGGTTYTVSFSERLKGNSELVVRLVQYDSSGARLKDSSSSFYRNRQGSTSTDIAWQKVSRELTTEANTTKMRIYIYSSYGDASGYVCIDDFSVGYETQKMETVTTEYVKNGGFESNFDLWTLCHGIGSAVDTSAYISLETAEVHGGNNSVKLSCDSAVNKGVQQDVAISGGTTYTISFWERLKGNSELVVRLVQYDSSGTKLKDSGSGFYRNRQGSTGTDIAWQKVSQELTTEANTAKMRIYIYSAYGDANGYVCVDDFSVSYSETAPAYVMGDGVAAMDGDYALKMYTADSATYSDITLEAGKQYGYTISVKSDATKSDFALSFYVGSDVEHTLLSGESEAASEWKTVSGTFTLDSAATEVGFKRSGEGAVYLDDVVLYALENGVPSTIELFWMHYYQEGTVSLKGTFPKNEGESYEGAMSFVINGEEKTVQLQYEGETLSVDLLAYLSADEKNTITIPADEKFVNDVDQAIFHITEDYTFYTQKVDGHWLTWEAEANVDAVQYVNMGRQAVYEFSNQPKDVLVVEGEDDLTLGGDIYSEEALSSVTTTRLGDYRVKQTIKNELYDYTLSLYKRGNVHDVLNDGESDTLDARDLVAIKQAVGAKPATFGYAKMKAADVNIDGVVDKNDAAYLRKVLVTTGEVYEPMIIASPDAGEEVALLGGDIYSFASNYSPGASVNYNESKTDIYAPNAVTLSWESEDGALYYTVKLATKAELQDAVTYVTLENSLEIEDLYSGADYYYQVMAKYEEKTVKSQIFHFSTAQLPRTIAVEGVSNTRDLGGNYTEDGKYRVKQGIAYRGGALDSITDDGINKMLYTYGVKTDLDLRGMSTTSPLGTDTTLYSYSAPQYTYTGGNHILKEENKEPLANAIKVFANKENYPIYFHCQIGRDRTGTVAFLLNALLGVGKDDLYRDYELSLFSKGGHSDNSSVQKLVFERFEPMYEYFEDYGTGTLAENVESFMTGYLGITTEEIATIKSMLLEEVTESGQMMQLSYSLAPASTESLLPVTYASASMEDEEFACDYSASTKTAEPNYVCYGSTEVKTWTEEEATSNNVPTGYYEQVVSVVHSSNNKGVLLDFSNAQIPIESVESITFRVYVGDDGNSTNSYPEVRIMKPGESSKWIMRYNASALTNQWIDITLGSDGTNFFSRSYSFTDVSEDGYLNKFELAVRNEANTVFYIDSITVQVAGDDTAPNVPVISTESMDVYATIGAIPVLNADSKVWSDGALSVYGTLMAGTHTCTLTMLDESGNATQKNLTFYVTSEEVEDEIVIDEEVLMEGTGL